MHTPSQPKLVPASGGRSFHLLGTTNLAKLTAADTGGTYLLTEQVTPPGIGVPPHVHTREDEIFVILDGEYESRLMKTFPWRRWALR